MSSRRPESRLVGRTLREEGRKTTSRSRGDSSLGWGRRVFEGDWDSTQYERSRWKRYPSSFVSTRMVCLEDSAFGRRQGIIDTLEPVQ